MTTAPRVHILTLGCPKNEADSRAMGESIAAAGYPLEADVDDADVLLINTCSFIEEAVQESIDTVLAAFIDWRSLAPGRRVMVAGCLPSRYGNELASELPEADAVIPVQDEGEVVRALADLVAPPSPRPTLPPAVGPFAYVSICDGCDRSCSFCTIPSIRGPFTGRPLVEVLDEIGRLVAAGAREIVLVGQDITAWGRHETSDLATLVRDAAKTSDLDWLRLMYVQPEGVSDGLLDAMAASDAVCRYLDIPLQHVAPSVLRRMGRSGGFEDFLNLLRRSRAALPGLVLRTTLMAGFPGESDDDVALLARFIEEAEIDHVGVFAYSREEGTPAASLPDQIPDAEARDRARFLRDIADETSIRRLRGLRGSTLDVLVDDDEDGHSVGRWYGQAPGIDGVVHLDRSFPVGKFVRAAVEDAVGHDLIAKTTL